MLRSERGQAELLQRSTVPRLVTFPYPPGQQRVTIGAVFVAQRETVVMLSEQSLDDRDDAIQVTFVHLCGDVFHHELVERCSRSGEAGKIRLRDGQTFILSGVIQDSDRETITKVPILGDLPIIGALFRGSSTQNTRSEVIIVVTPRIIDDSQNASWGYTYQPGTETQKVLDSNQRKTQ